MEEQADRMFVNTRWRRFHTRRVVGMSDAGLHPGVGGYHAGMGWMLVDRETKEFVVAAQWHHWVEEGEAMAGQKDSVFAPRHVHPASSPSPD